MAGAASFGSRVAYVGKIRDDQLGAVFQHDIRSAGVHFATPIAPDGPPTARSLILVTPDAHRTMSTYLGAAVELGPEDIDTDLVARCAVTYLEGYLWDKPRAKDAFRVAMAAARGAGRRVSLTLSDSFCVERHREEFRALVDDQVNILFANEEEILALTLTRDLGTAVAAVRGRSEIVVVTRSEHGSMVVTADDTVEVPAAPLSGSSTPPARATSTRPASSTGSRTAGRSPSAPRSDRWRPPRSSRTSARAPRPTSRPWRRPRSDRQCRW